MTAGIWYNDNYEATELRQRIDKLESTEVEFKHAERALRETEIKYSALVENSKDGIVIVQDGMLKFANTISRGYRVYTWGIKRN